MTAKEKAREILDKYEIILSKVNYYGGKQCALIAVDEVIGQWEYIDVYLADGLGTLNPNLKYWYEVGSEMEKL